VAAPTVLFCDGVLCDGFIWKYLWGDLATTGPVAHWHYRGHGRSGGPVDADAVEVDDFARDLDRVRRHLGDPPVVLVGHSFGVQVALEGYRLRPEGIAGLVLCCGAPGKVTETFHGTNVLAQLLPKVMKWVTEYPELARALWTRVPTDLSVKLSFLTGEVDKSNMRRDDLVPYLKHMTTVDFALFVKVLRSAGEHSAEDLLAQIGVPSLVVAAERDTFTPPDLARKMSETIPGGELLLLKNGSHAAVIEQPDLMRTRVMQFLRDRVAPFLAEQRAHAAAGA
jgi:pimeloyl-ACP methyl ester carboxylesterase